MEPSRTVLLVTFSVLFCLCPNFFLSVLQVSHSVVFILTKCNYLLSVLLSVKYEIKMLFQNHWSPCLSPGFPHNLKMWAAWGAAGENYNVSSCLLRFFFVLCSLRFLSHCEAFIFALVRFHFSTHTHKHARTRTHARTHAQTPAHPLGSGTSWTALGETLLWKGLWQQPHWDIKY